MPEAAAAERVRRAPAIATPAAVFALILLTAVWAWWAWKEGAYFGVVLLPGLIVLCLGTALLAGFAPWRISLSQLPAGGARAGALAALGLWALLSAAWSPSPDIAIADGQRILAYALAFGLGLWLATCSARGWSWRWSRSRPQRRSPAG